MPVGRSLVFVYNADSGVLQGMKDYVSRDETTGADRCNLWALTFSPIGMKKEWKRVVHDLGIPSRFISRDEFTREFRSVAATFPSAFLQTGNELFHFISTEEINRCARLEDLISLVRQRLVQPSEK